MKTMTPVGLIIAGLMTLTSLEAAPRGGHPGGGGRGGGGFSAARGHAGGGARFSSPGARFSGGGPRFSKAGARFSGRGPGYLARSQRFSSARFRSSPAISRQSRFGSNRAIINRAALTRRIDRDRIGRSRGNQQIIASRDRFSARRFEKRDYAYARRFAYSHRDWDRRRHHHWRGRWWRYAGGYWFPFYAGYYPYASYYSYPYDYYPYDYYDQGIYTSSVEYSDSTVSAVQTQLASMGYYHGAIDGALGPQTRDAVRRYQGAHGLSATGVLTTATLQSLGVG